MTLPPTGICVAIVPAVRRTVMSDEEARLRLEASISGLADRAPVMSARKLLTRQQQVIFVLLVVVIAFCLIIATLGTVLVLVGIVTVIYVVAVSYRTYLFVKSTGSNAVEVVSDEEARAVPDEELPFYTVMIAAYREASVINDLIVNVGRLEYPVSRLEVLLLVEGDDEETLDAVADVDPGPQFELVIVPPAEPRTKPKALNFGLTLARGDIVTVFDVEDEPDPLQLRRAAVALGRLGSEVACLQAKLSFNNAHQNLITKWFTIEYQMWFAYFLPGLAALGAPIPLGGTSNHFRRMVLRGLGGWDPYNVTEDADLGVRIYREGCTVRVLESTTFEEANSDFVNWIKQRSRWHKGYLQTLFIHLRSPGDTFRELGWKGMAQFCIFVGGTPILSMLNPLFWFLTVLWFVAQPHFILEIFPAPVYYVGLLSWVFGNFLMVYITLIASRAINDGRLWWYGLVVPFYWVMMSMAALKALFQLVITPSFWEKTTHGLWRRSDDTGAGHGHLPEPGVATSTGGQ
jgi:glycosyltransferase XagB